MKKLLSREPTPEMAQAVNEQMFQSAVLNAWRVMWDAAPSLPEPGEVERELHDLIKQATEERSHYYVAKVANQAADLIAALDYLHKLDHSLADQWRERAEKAEARVAELEKANVGLADEVRQLTDKEDPLAQNYWRKRANTLEQMLADATAETDAQAERAMQAEAELVQNNQLMVLMREAAANWRTEAEGLKAECERLREDAERYRWIRNGQPGYDPRLELVGPELDAAIDAAKGKP